MKKRSALKGFTLIEMIIVVAIFGMIMAAALSMIGPVQNVFRNAYQTHDAQAISENFRRYVGDQLQYSDRMWLYTGMELTDATERSVENQVKAFRENYYLTPHSVTLPDSSVVSQDRVFPYSKMKNNDDVYVLRIDNPSMDLSLPGTTVSTSSKLGTVTLSRYKNGSLVETKVWSENTDYYDDYAFDITVQTVAKVSGGTGVEYKYIDLNSAVSGSVVSPTNLAMTMKMYRKEPQKSNYATSDLVDANSDRTITFKLKNLVTKTDALARETIEFTDKTNFPSPEDKNRFEWYDISKSNAKHLAGAVPSGDIYFIFTKSPVIENVIK